MQEKKLIEKKYSSILITGASSGLGKELAILLAKRTPLLILLGQNTAELNLTAEECKKNHSSKNFEVICLIGDLCDPIFFDTVLKLFKTYPIDVVINNAGAGLYGKTLEFPITYLQKLFQLNGWVPLRLTYEALQLWQKENKPGVILQIGSALSFIPAPFASLYGAAKSFIVQWSLSLAEELVGMKQKVLVFCPGMIKTPFRKRASLGKDTDLEGLEIRTAAFYAIKQLDSLKLLEIVPKRDQILLFLSRFMPLKLVLKIIRKRLEIRS